MFGQCIGNELAMARKEIKNNSHKRKVPDTATKSNTPLQTAFVLQKNYTQQQGVTAHAVDDSGKLVKIDEAGNEVEELNDEETAEKRRLELDQMKAAVVKLQD